MSKLTGILDEFGNPLTRAEIEPHRLNVFKDFLEKFKREIKSTAESSQYDSIEYASEILNDYYWRLIWDFIDPMIEKSDANLHYYKVISAMELTIMAVLPLYYTEDENNTSLNDEQRDNRRRILNASFAWVTSYALMSNWRIDYRQLADDESLMKVCLEKELIKIETEDDKTEKAYFSNTFKEEHINWLKELNTASTLPILSNSQTWRMVFVIKKHSKNTQAT